MDEDLNKLLVWAEALARSAGKIMREYFDLADKGVETKGNNTPVTIADTKINDLLIKRVAKHFPDHGVLGEEASAHADRKKLWVCDPIDGTEGFIMGSPTAMFSLAFVVDGQPLMACMYEPLLDKMFTAIKARGALLNGRPIHVSKRDSLQEARVGTTSSIKQLLDREAFIKSLLAEGVKLALVSGNVFKGSLVAAGHIDATVFPGRSAHDIAAEKLIVEEAGGKVTDLDGNEQRYDRKIRGAIISNGLLHDTLVEQLAKVGSESYLGY